MAPISLHVPAVSPPAEPSSAAARAFSLGAG
jgi:hypothetical protein